MSTTIGNARISSFDLPLFGCFFVLHHHNHIILDRLHCEIVFGSIGAFWKISCPSVVFFCWMRTGSTLHRKFSHICPTQAILHDASNAHWYALWPKQPQLKRNQQYRLELSHCFGTTVNDFGLKNRIEMNVEKIDYLWLRQIWLVSPKHFFFPSSYASRISFNFDRTRLFISVIFCERRLWKIANWIMKFKLKSHTTFKLKCVHKFKWNHTSLQSECSYAKKKLSSSYFKWECNTFFRTWMASRLIITEKHLHLISNRKKTHSTPWSTYFRMRKKKKGLICLMKLFNWWFGEVDFRELCPTNSQACKHPKWCYLLFQVFLCHSIEKCTHNCYRNAADDGHCCSQKSQKMKRYHESHSHPTIIFNSKMNRTHLDGISLSLSLSW